MNKILLHACCAPCASYPINLLRDEGYEPAVYFYNPNIYPQDEHEKRLDELIRYAQKENFELIYEPYTPDDFIKAAYGLENEPEKGKRCEKCFYLRLSKTAQKAAALNIPEFTTTLTVSPHKVSCQVFCAGEICAEQYRVKFAPYDFKKKDGFKITQQIARENNMYKQTYCGCIYSLHSRDLRADTMSALPKI